MVSKQVSTEKKKAYLAQLTAHGSRFQGRGELIQFLKGFRITRNEAIKAKCYDCMGFYDQAQDKDCNNTTCPLYPYMPYRANGSAPKNDIGT